MKKIIITTLAILAGISLSAGPISSFADLDSATVDETLTQGTTFSTPAGISNQSFIMDFTMTTPGSFSTYGGVLVDFGADAKGASLVMEDDRLVFTRSSSIFENEHHVSQLKYPQST